MSAPLQLALIPADAGRARKRDPETSKDAAKTVNVAHLEGEVLLALRIAGAEGRTTEQLADELHLPLVSVSPRMKPLAERDLVRDSGVKRENRSGRNAIVWVTT